MSLDMQDYQHNDPRYQYGNHNLDLRKSIQIGFPY